MEPGSRSPRHRYEYPCRHRRSRPIKTGTVCGNGDAQLVAVTGGVGHNDIGGQPSISASACCDSSEAGCAPRLGISNKQSNYAKEIGMACGRTAVFASGEHQFRCLLEGLMIGKQGHRRRHGVRTGLAPFCHSACKTLIFLRKLERAKGFEPSTPTLARLCSTPELHPLARRWAASRAYMAEELYDCNS